MSEQEALAALAEALADDGPPLLRVVLKIIPTRFGRCMMPGVDWRRAAGAAIEIMEDLHGGYPTAEQALAAIDCQAERMVNQEGDDDWRTEEVRERHERVEAGLEPDL